MHQTTHDSASDTRQDHSPELCSERRLALLMTAVAVAVGLLVLMVEGLPQAATAAAGSPLGVAVVRCEPLFVTGAVTSTIQVDLYVANVANLYGADIKFGFDPSRAQVVDADPFMPGVQIQPLGGFLSPDLVVRRDANNVVGTIQYAVTQLNPSQPVTGSGSLARITFQPLMSGTFTMPNNGSLLAGFGGTAIASIALPCIVTFGNAPSCFDFDGDTQVTVHDISLPAARWSTTMNDPDPDGDPLTPGYDPRYDADRDGVISVLDIALVADHWLQPC